MKHFTISTAEFQPRFEHEKAVAFREDDFGAPAKVQVIRILPGQRIKPHHHNQRTELFHVVSGTGKIKVNGETAATSPDELVLCEPGDVHEFINNSDNEKFTIAVFRTNDPGDGDMIFEEGEE